MAKNTNYLAISDCIIMSDADIIRFEKKDERGNPRKKIKTMNRLAKEMVKRSKKPISSMTIYTRLYRLEKEGYSEEPKEIIDGLIDILSVSREELIKRL